MNILQRFWKSFEHKDRNAVNTYDKIRAKIDFTKRMVPWQITNVNRHNHQSTPQTGMTWSSDNRILITNYDCGCKFEEGINIYGFSGHWCEKHAKINKFETPIEQDINEY